MLTLPVTHSILISIYHIFKDGVVFKDLGTKYYNQLNKEHKINAYLKGVVYAFFAIQKNLLHSKQIHVSCRTNLFSFYKVTKMAN